MAPPYTIPSLTDLPLASTTENVILGRPGQTLDEDSQVSIWAVRESSDVTFGVTIGQQVAVPNGSFCNLQFAVGSGPSRQDDFIGTFLGAQGNDIIIQGINVNAAAQELALLVDVTALSDLATGLAR